METRNKRGRFGEWELETEGGNLELETDEVDSESGK